MKLWVGATQRSLMTVAETQWFVRLRWEPRYCCLGVIAYWTSNQDDPSHPDQYPMVEQLHLYICIVPCLPLILTQVRTTYVAALEGDR